MSDQQLLTQAWQIHQQKRYADAERMYRAVIGKSPKDANAWCYLGIVRHDQRDYQEAVECYRRALQLQPQFPIALNNLGNSLRYVGEFQAADESFQKAIDLKPDYLNAYKNRGTLHVWTGHLDSGLAYYQQALRLNPQEAELHRNLGVIYLLQGKFEEGWQEYRWRWRVGDLLRPRIQAPIWDGGDLKGRSVVLTAEQGLGDTLHFVRFAEILRARGAKTLVYCQPQLMALLQSSPNVGPVYPYNLDLSQPFDLQCSLLDAADHCVRSLADIPSSVPYIHPNESLIQYWKNRFPMLLAGLPNSPGKLKIGINWQGNPDHQADTFRSFPLEQFQRIASLPNTQLISLQAGYGKEQLGQWTGPPIAELPADMDTTSGAFVDTAAVLKQLDLVITSDTAIAHLAGALGVPTWIALGYIPDWRWLLKREDSPWYPSVRLFRQTKLGDWNSVFEHMATELASARIKN